MYKTSIGCGVLQHRIFISHVDDCGNKLMCDATDDAIKAVRDYMVDDIKHNHYNNSVGYSWKTNDNKVVKLCCFVEVLNDTSK